MGVPERPYQYWSVKMSSTLSIFSNQSALEDIEITQELAIRPRKPADLAAENRAIKLLVRRSAEGPEHVFQLLVDAVLELCRAAGSAGVCLLEPPMDGQEEMVFRIAALAGEYREYEWGRTPRNASPCGLCLDYGPTLLLNPERRFPYLGAAQPRIVEALLIPLPTEHGPAGALWITSHDEQSKFDAEDVRIMSDLGGIATAGYQMGKALHTLEMERMELQGHLQEKARLQASLEQKEVLLEEIHHQVKNNLHAIGSLLSIQSGFLTDSGARRLFDEMQDRVQAIAGLHRRCTIRRIWAASSLAHIWRRWRKGYSNRTEASRRKSHCESKARM